MALDYVALILCLLYVGLFGLESYQLLQVLYSKNKKSTYRNGIMLLLAFAAWCRIFIWIKVMIPTTLDNALCMVIYFLPVWLNFAAISCLSVFYAHALYNEAFPTAYQDLPWYLCICVNVVFCVLNVTIAALMENSGVSAKQAKLLYEVYVGYAVFLDTLTAVIIGYFGYYFFNSPRASRKHWQLPRSPRLFAAINYLIVTCFLLRSIFVLLLNYNRNQDPHQFDSKSSGDVIFNGEHPVTSFTVLGFYLITEYVPNVALVYLLWRPGKVSLLSACFKQAGECMACTCLPSSASGPSKNKKKHRSKTNAATNSANKHTNGSPAKSSHDGAEEDEEEEHEYKPRYDYYYENGQLRVQRGTMHTDDDHDDSLHDSLDGSMEDQVDDDDEEDDEEDGDALDGDDYHDDSYDDYEDDAEDDVFLHRPLQPRSLNARRRRKRAKADKQDTNVLSRMFRGIFFNTNSSKKNAKTKSRNNSLKHHPNSDSKGHNRGSLPKKSLDEDGTIKVIFGDADELQLSAELDEDVPQHYQHPVPVQGSLQYNTSLNRQPSYPHSNQLSTSNSSNNNNIIPSNSSNHFHNCQAQQSPWGQQSPQSNIATSLSGRTPLMQSRYVPQHHLHNASSASNLHSNLHSNLNNHHSASFHSHTSGSANASRFEVLRGVVVEQDHAVHHGNNSSNQQNPAVTQNALHTSSAAVYTTKLRAPSAGDNDYQLSFSMSSSTGAGTQQHRQLMNASSTTAANSEALSATLPPSIPPPPASSSPRFSWSGSDRM